jgi:hypothetical protein
VQLTGAALGADNVCSSSKLAVDAEALRRSMEDLFHHAARAIAADRFMPDGQRTP